MEEKKLEEIKVEEENLEKVAGGIECDEVYNTAKVYTCQCGNTPAHIVGYYKSSQRGFVTKRFPHPMCIDCATKEANSNYTDMEFKEFYYLEGTGPAKI